MSFALEFRKKHLVKRSGESQAERAVMRDDQARSSKQTPPAPKPMSGRRVAQALLVAAVILAVFNSGALVQYARGLSDKMFGPPIITASETWHAMMERGRLTGLTEQIRQIVSQARQSSWDDIAKGLGLMPERQLGEAAPAHRSLGGDVTSIPGRYGEPPAKPVRRTSGGQSG